VWCVHGSGPGYFGQFLYIPSRCEGESRAENPGISAGSVVRVGQGPRREHEATPPTALAPEYTGYLSNCGSM
jgi:hypothetical protein